MTRPVREPDVAHCAGVEDERTPGIQRALLSSNPESRIQNPGL